MIRSASCQSLLSSERYLSELKAIQEKLSSFLRPFPCRVYLFGSWATGQAQLSSDVDIAILPTTSMPVGLLSQLRFELEESSILLRVDLIDLRHATSAFKDRVISEGKLWIDSANA